MAQENGLRSLIQQKIVRRPNLTPKTKLGQKTMYANNTVEYNGLKPEYYYNPDQIQPLIEYLGKRHRTQPDTFVGHILTNEEVLDAPDGIYTWILKRGDLHITPLLSNQEIGTLHTNIDVLTLHQNNVGQILLPTFKNMRSPSNKPLAAGEMLLTRDRGGLEVFFNLQSGTFSEPIFKCRAQSLGEQRGLDKKAVSKQLPDLKMECRAQMITEVSVGISSVLGAVPLLFLDCVPEIEDRLASIPFLAGVFDFGLCRDDDDYFEHLAGKNLIRRFTAYTSNQNRNMINTYFKVKPAEASVKRRFNQVNSINNSKAMNAKTAKTSKTAPRNNKLGGKRVTKRRTKRRNIQ